MLWRLRLLTFEQKVILALLVSILLVIAGAVKWVVYADANMPVVEAPVVERTEKPSPYRSVTTYTNPSYTYTPHPVSPTTNPVEEPVESEEFDEQAVQAEIDKLLKEDPEVAFVVNPKPAPASEPQQETVAKQLDGSGVIVLGDSITVACQNAIQERLPNAYIDGIGSTTFADDNSSGASGLTRLRKLAASDSLRDVVVFAFGTNLGSKTTDKEWQTMIADLVTTVGFDKQIILMTFYALDYDYSGWSAIVRREAAKYDNVTVMDWEQELINTGVPEKYLHVEDGCNDVHPTSQGITLFTELLYNAVYEVS